MLVLLHGKSRDRLAMHSDSINPSLISAATHKIGTSISPTINRQSNGICIYALRVAYGNNLLRINNTNTMVTMSREPIEKSCSSKQFQYSQETIETLQNIIYVAGNDLVDETSLIVAAIIVVVNDDVTATHRHRHQ